MQRKDLLGSLDDLSKVELDVVVVGSGPAGVAVVEQIYERPKLRIGVIERGGILALEHFNNLLRNDLRRKFLDTYGEHPWEGDLKEGMLLFALGGRGIASGAHLRRFDEADFTLWPQGKWPDTIINAWRIGLASLNSLPISSLSKHSHRSTPMEGGFR